jgi:hypothetical protein
VKARVFLELRDKALQHKVKMFSRKVRTIKALKSRKGQRQLNSAILRYKEAVELPERD